MHKQMHRGGAVLMALVGVAGGVGLLGVGVGEAQAQVWQYDWTFFTGPFVGGTHQFFDGTAPYFAQLKVTGGDSGVAGDTDVRFIACEDMWIGIGGWYFKGGGDGTEDSAYYSINGVKTVLATNASPGSYGKYLDVQKGDVLRFGVHTADGTGGAGVLELYVASGFIRGYEDFQWKTFDDGPLSAGFVIPPPTLGVTGGDGGGQERAYLFAPLQCSTSFEYGGTYSSIDSGPWDSAFTYQSFNGGETFTTISTNATQGPVSGELSAFGGTLTHAAALGFGVDSIDGQFGPGILTLDTFKASQLPAEMFRMAWAFNDSGTGGSGSIGSPGFFDMTIIGGNNGTAGDSEYTVQAAQAYCVQAEVEYSSTDVDCWDFAYYVVNGVRTPIACNNMPGTYNVEFNVPAGQTFGFGVNTDDGQFGAGTAIVRRFRAWPVNESACYPDCDQSGTLAIDDFICFQTNFAIGDPSADCDASGTLSIDDFICFQTSFALGC